MSYLGFLILTCLFSCEGKVFAPSADKTLTFARNSAESRIVWSFNDTIAPTTRRTWSFIPPGQSPVVLAILDGNGPVKKFSTLLEFEIEEPATLVLKNVNQTYNGKYQFGLIPSIGTGISEVVVSIGDPPDNVKLTVTRSGKSATITCSAEAQPPASFKIFLNETNLVSTENTYTISYVNISHVGNYSCVAKNILGNKTSNVEYLPLETRQMQTTTSTTIKPSPTTQIIASSTINGTVSTTTEPPSSTTTEPPRTTTTKPPTPLVAVIVGSVVGVLALILLVVVVVYCYKAKQNEKRNGGGINPAGANHYELENEAPDAGGDNAYDTVGPVGASGSKKKPPEKESLPPVYAAVDKNNRQGNTLYASLDTEAMQPKRESKKEPDRTPQTEYASIDFAKSAKDVPKADLV